MIEIVAYREGWRDEFRQIGTALRQAVGDGALRIDHIGSTSVPHLAAKDIIDVQMTVASFDNFAPIRMALASLGYAMLEGINRDHNPDHSQEDTKDDPLWEKRLFKPPDSQRPTNLHVRVNGRANQRYALLFRDYLRQHSEAAHAYAAVKHRLAQYVGDNHVAYTDTKDPVCDLIMQAAEKWAAETGWQPGQSDA
jgi:GrpB-like predicted nucleotidyltransferase (UPF0157 family)